MYETYPDEYRNYGATMRTTVLIDNTDVIQRILKHLNLLHSAPDHVRPTDHNPPCPKGKILPLTYEPVPNIPATWGIAETIRGLFY